MKAGRTGIMVAVLTLLILAAPALAQQTADSLARGRSAGSDSTEAIAPSRAVSIADSTVADTAPDNPTLLLMYGKSDPLLSGLDSTMTDSLFEWQGISVPDSVLRFKLGPVPSGLRFKFNEPAYGGLENQPEQVKQRERAKEFLNNK